MCRKKESEWRVMQRALAILAESHAQELVEEEAGRFPFFPLTWLGTLEGVQEEPLTPQLIGTCVWVCVCVCL